MLGGDRWQIPPLYGSYNNSAIGNYGRVVGSSGSTTGSSGSAVGTYGSNNLREYRK